MTDIVPYGHMVQTCCVDRVRAKVARCFGPLPPRTPLEPVVTGAIPRDGHRIEKVITVDRATLQHALLSWGELAAGDLTLVDPWDEQMRCREPAAGRRSARHLGIGKVVFSPR